MPRSTALISSSSPLSQLARPTFAIVGEPFIELSADTPLRLSHVADPRLLTSASNAEVWARLALIARNTLEAALPSQVSRFPLSELDYALYQALAAGIASNNLPFYFARFSTELLSLCRTIERYPDKDLAAALGAARLKGRDSVFASNDDTSGHPNSIAKSIREAAARAASESFSGADVKNFDNILNGLFATIGRGAHAYLAVGTAPVGSTSDDTDDNATLIIATLESLQLMPMACKTDEQRVCAYLAAATFLSNMEKLAELRLEPSFQPAFAEQVANRLREYSVALKTLSHFGTTMRLASARRNVSVLLELFAQFAGVPVDFSAKLADADERVASAKAQTLLFYRDAVDSVLSALAEERGAQLFVVADDLGYSMGVPADANIPKEALQSVDYAHYARLAAGAPVSEVQISGSAPTALLRFATEQLTAYSDAMLALQADGSYYHSAPTLLELPPLLVARGPSLLTPRLRSISDEGDYAVGIPQVSWATDASGKRKATSLLASHCFKPVVLSTIEASLDAANLSSHALALAGVSVPADGAIDPWLRNLPVPASYLEGEQPIPAHLTMADFLRDYPVDRSRLGFDPLIDLTVQLTSSSVSARAYLLAHLATAFITLAPISTALGRSGKASPPGLQVIQVLFKDQTEPTHACLVPEARRFPPYVYGVRADLFIKAQLAFVAELDSATNAEAALEGADAQMYKLPVTLAECVHSRNSTSVALLQIRKVPDLRAHNVKPFFTYFKVNNSTLAPCARLVVGDPETKARTHALPLSQTTTFMAETVGLPVQDLPSLIREGGSVTWVAFDPSEATAPYHAFRWTLRPVAKWDRVRRVIDANGRFLAWHADWIGYVQPSALLMNPQVWKSEPVVQIQSDIPNPPVPQHAEIPTPAPTPPLPVAPTLSSEASAPSALNGLSNQGTNRSPEATAESQDPL